MSATRRRRFRPRLQSLEDRCVPATFTVTTTDDLVDPNDGLRSLREAVIKANNLPGLDTIVFKPGLQGTILLTAGQITITGSLVIAGPGAGKITVDGDAASRIFRIDDGNANAFKNVTLKGLTLFNGEEFDPGGAIQSLEHLTLIRTVITGNTSVTGGGGVHVSGARITIRGSTIRDNESTSSAGGVAAVNGNVLVENCTIEHNRTVSQGGGINVSNGKLAVRNTILASNQAQHGGSLAGVISKLTVANCTITGNQTTGGGGGLFASAMVATITNTKITLNTAGSSGGGVVSSGITRFNHCTISGNTSVAGSGGGISHTIGTLSVTASVISGNRCGGGSGGGIFTAATLGPTVIRTSTIAGNVAETDGGGIYCAQDPLVVRGCVIRDNTALNGDGGGIAQVDGRLNLTASTISGNRAAADGGGVSIFHTLEASTIRGCTFAGNSAFQGGGLFGAVSYPVLIQNSTISGNRATNNGGAMRLVNCDRWTIQNSTIAFNEAAATGGGIWLGSGLGSGKVDLVSSIVAENRAPASPDLYSLYNPGDDFNITVSLIGSTTGASVPVFDQTSMNLLGKDPLLAPLSFNGGPTQTHALRLGSPAINKGSNPAALPFDQRGAPFKRKLGPKVDIGAFERQ